MGKLVSRKKVTAEGKHTDIHIRGKCVKQGRIGLERRHECDGRWHRLIQVSDGAEVAGAKPAPAWKEAVHA